MLITNCLWAGHLSSVLTTLRRSLGQYARHHRFIYVGATSDQKGRWTAHEREDWEHMILLWSTSSHQQIRRAKTELIDWAWERYSGRTIVENQRAGGGGLSNDSSRYFVYVLIEK